MPPNSNNGIGLCIFATKRYAMFLEGVIATARRFWHTRLPLSIVTFTDVLPPLWLSDVRLPISHQPWPYVTLYRYRHIANASQYLQSFKYLFMCDADMEFVGHIGDELLGGLVATIHGGHAKTPPTKLPFLNCPKSRAHIQRGTGTRYYAGGFQGGETQRYLSACAAMAEAIEIDEKIGYIADWHDESHWNAYLVRNPPNVVLSPSYCCGDLNLKPADVKLLALAKPHAAMRK